MGPKTAWIGHPIHADRPEETQPKGEIPIY